jgi:aminopeptidase
MNFKEKLHNYAKLLIKHGLNVQSGQVVNITGEIINRELIELLVKEAYLSGAKYVNVDFVDPELQRLRVQYTTNEEYLKYVPSYIPIKYDDFVKDHSAVLRLTGSENPDSLSDLPPKKVNDVLLSYRQSLRKYFDEGVGKKQIHWLVASSATPQWAKKIYPELDEKKAHESLWDAIFKICRADKPDCLDLWKEHNTILQQRAKKLTNLKIKEFHFTGPDTDFKVYLSPKAVFIGGGDIGPYGQEFEPNIPTEECFTTPDCRTTTGKVKVTRPVLINGKLIKDLHIEFKDGAIVNFKASEGQENFAEYINKGERAKYLGELAVVGIDSPVFQSGRVFQEILYDENAACHIAIGSAYRFCIDGGTKMSNEELNALGCNISNVHTDMMISNEHVNVNVTTFDGKSFPIIKNGAWVSF